MPAAWRDALTAAFQTPAAAALQSFLTAERARTTVFPAPEETFRALDFTAPADVRCVILGQDPYPTPGHANGLAFSVRPGVKPPRSLVNMFKELRDDLGLPLPTTGALEPWARQGVLLLNTVLTVRNGEAGSHRGQGWEPITDAMIQAVAHSPRPVVFVLWGSHAQTKQTLIPPRHPVLKSSHPSPLSASRGFLGSQPYSQVNAALRQAGRTEIDWRL